MGTRKTELPRNIERGSWSLREFAARHGKSVSHIYTQAAEGRLPTVRPGGSDMRVTPQGEQRWLNGETVDRETAEQ